LPNDDNVTVDSLSDSKNEKHAFTTQDAAPQPIDTQSGKSYLRQYEKTTDETQQPTTSAEIPVLASVPMPGKKAERSLV